MANQNGISGVAVAFIGVGGILVYAGFRGINPLQALREIGGGHPSAVSSNPADLASVFNAGAAVGETVQGIPGQIVVSNAQKYVDDIYSQARRTQKGYSDCSSFCDKAFTDSGIAPPVKWASTANYRISPEWKTIPQAQSRAGDIAISSHHMVLVTADAGSAAIGQQRTGVNVRTGSVANLMGSQTYVYKRYVGKTNTGLGGKTVST